MTKNRKRIIKITVGAVLAALNIVLKIASEYIVPIKDFGLPFHAIPLVIAGLLLGPYQAILVAVVADLIGGIASQYDFSPLYVFGKVVWAVIPALFTKDTKGSKWWVVIFLTYILVTIFNTIPIIVYSGWEGALGTLPLRLGVIPAFSLIIAYITGTIYQRIKGTSVDFGLLSEKKEY